MTVGRNWSESYSFSAQSLETPESVDEVRRIVAKAERVHAYGSRHSFSGVADGLGILLDLAGIPADPVLDAAAGTVTVGAAMRYAELTPWLHARGFAIHNMASLPHLSVVGAVATGTHGSGDRLGTLATAVAGLELVTADGSLMTLRRGDPDFDGAVVALGALGIVVRVTLDVEPAFSLRQDKFLELRWACLADDLDAVMGAGYSVSLFTMWGSATIGQVWVKTRLPETEPPAARMVRLGAREAAAGETAGMLSVRQLTPFGGIPGPWHERLPHMTFALMPDNLELQSEYMLPRANLARAIEILRPMAERIDPHLKSTELRSMAADRLWLSFAYGDPRIAIQFNWKQHTAAVDALSREIEALLLPLGGRPHWAKLIHTDAAGLAPLYPKFADFQALVRRLDPKGKFGNPFLARHVMGG